MTTGRSYFFFPQYVPGPRRWDPACFKLIYNLLDVLWCEVLLQTRQKMLVCYNSQLFYSDATTECIVTLECLSLEAFNNLTCSL